MGVSAVILLLVRAVCILALVVLTLWVGALKSLLGLKTCGSTVRGRLTKQVAVDGRNVP